MEIESKNKEKPCSKVQKKRELKSLQNVFFIKPMFCEEAYE